MTPYNRGAVARRRGVAAVLLALAVALIVWLRLGGDNGLDRGQGPAIRVAGGSSSPAAVAGRERVIATLKRSVDRAAALGGSVEAAAMLDTWERPAVVASSRGGRRREMRMWSMSKIATAVALLRGSGWDGNAGQSLSAEVERALWGAITRSENCRQRRVILELQQVSGGSPEAARAAVAAVFDQAGAEARLGHEVAPPDPSCIEYLEGQDRIAEPLAPALLLGISTWRIADAVRFVDALGAGRYGGEVTSLLVAAMRAPKAPSREVAPGELTAPLDWGAGRAFAGLAPAYKAGWGGSLQGAYLAGQIALVDMPGGARLAIAVMFHPDAQPPTDDPGVTEAPRGVELVMASVRRALEG